MYSDRFFKPGTAPTESERNRLYGFALSFWLVRRSPAANRFPYPLANLRMDFAHTLHQWHHLGQSHGKGNRANRRAVAMARANGPYLNWPEMTITAT